MQSRIESSAEVRQIGAVIYTPSARTSGYVRTIHWRLSDTLNAVDQDFVLVHDARVQPLHGTPEDELSIAWSLVRKDNIVLVLVREAKAGTELPPARQALVAPRETLQAKVETWPFIIAGTMHIPVEIDLLQHVHDPHRQFMVMTDARVVYQPSPLLGFEAPVVLVNRKRIEVVLDASQVGRKPIEDVEMAPLARRDADLSGLRAAELLAGTTIFKVVALPQLQELCEEQCRARRISRKLVEAGVEVFGQGDLGDSMYVVESGSLQVLLRPARDAREQQVALLGPGEIFGEMAILGEGRRTASVRAVEQCSLMAIHEEAVQALIQRFPAASTRLLNLILARRGSLVHTDRSRG